MQTDERNSKAGREGAGALARGAMGCAVFTSAMPIWWVAQKLMPAEVVDMSPFVFGAVTFGFGHLLIIAALFSKLELSRWWARTALVVMWASVIVWFLVIFAFDM